MSTISLRLPESLHESARALAQRENISINRLICPGFGGEGLRLDDRGVPRQARQTCQSAEVRESHGESPRRGAGGTRPNVGRGPAFAGPGSPCTRQGSPHDKASGDARPTARSEANGTSLAWKCSSPSPREPASTSPSRPTHRPDGLHVVCHPAELASTRPADSQFVCHSSDFPLRY
ncbi:MAG: toxin-antitoxin system HicB family antitoxin [Sedimentisphaerales bacterium]|nr:toxin-antitoxin system HicB family antitoxin [Sedimentisphaerales bacterium]